ncbi:MAG: hypothetical protein QXF05_02825 [Thermofilaceae archaeon]
MSEEIERVVESEMTSPIRPYLEVIAKLAKEIEESARRCDYRKVLEKYFWIGVNVEEMGKSSFVGSAAAARIYSALDKFNERIEKILNESCLSKLRKLAELK